MCAVPEAKAGGFTQGGEVERAEKVEELTSVPVEFTTVAQDDGPS